ncbi:unnamed protein product [Mytilus edulis]|uniref:Uncharacterized protein n=1 Tax=Mytilus edulis TaxID=6550 RepID=A0A8S3V5Y4_MYTED|nr:unnamed protein product [Mytilus edulis]
MATSDDDFDMTELDLLGPLIPNFLLETDVLDDFESADLTIPQETTGEGSEADQHEPTAVPAVETADDADTSGVLGDNPTDGVAYYDTKLSYGLFPSTFMMKSLTTELNETEDYIKTNYISLTLFYKNLKTTITEQKPKYENVGDVFSNVGGQMGLFLGASILTITELCEFILFVIWYLLVRLFRRNIVVQNGNKMHLSIQGQKK